MFYVGLDIHSKRISVCVLSETGQVVRRSQVRTIEEMMRIDKAFRIGEPMRKALSIRAFLHAKHSLTEYL